MLLTLELTLAGLMLFVFVLGLLWGPARRREIGAVTAAGLAGLLVLSFVLDSRGPLFGGAFVMDGLARFFKQVFLLATLLGVVGGLALPQPTFHRRAPEYHLLILASLLGMMLLASARELVLLFVAFELMSIPLYVLAGFLKREEMAVEAALKFFLVGSLSTAVLAYGLSFLYGVTGSTMLPDVVRALGTGDPLLVLGFVLVLAGVGFKIAAFPFHMWVPDTYEAASTPFVAWLSVAPKAAGFAAIFRVFIEGAGDRAVLWVPLAATLGGLTIVAGNLMALPQTNVKRLLAYSGIAHIGYMLLGVAAVSPFGVAVVLFYLVAYVFSNMGAFLVVEVVAQAEGSTGLTAFRGLAQRSPLLALAMLLFLLSLGGIPFVVGFWAKLYVFWAAAEAGLYGLVLLGAVLTVVALFYYLMIAKQMYIDAPATPTPLPIPPALGLVLLASALAVVLLGLYPRPLVETALRAAVPLF
ncbi:MAG TPA: NADH-quinone oxidoreductase subunit N [Methylomirabilota bacterium]|jgi:NADH-quinone oxidoreductase subunit N|nr:NADH-quinone oxidoreductase subunit N [Methylomirabilota bacterium]